MPVTAGLVLDGEHSLPEVCAPLAADLRRCFCVVDIQAGPLDSLWLFASLEHERTVEELSWKLPSFANTSTRGFRAGSWPRLAAHLLVDEWSYYYFIDAPEAEASARASKLATHIGDFSEDYLQRLDRHADLFICHGDGWWEFFTGRPEWHRTLFSQLAGCRERSLAQAGNPA